MHRTHPQPGTAGPARKKKDERGMALIFALLGILLLSMLAAALLVVTRADALATFNYKNQIKGSYIAMAGVHRTVDWFRVTYSPWLNPTTGGTPDAATNPPVLPTTYAGSPNAPTLSSNPVVLGDSANFPTVSSNTISTGFNTMRGALNTISLGNTTGDFTIKDVTLLSHDRFKAFDGITDRIVERWQLRVQGRIRDTANRTLAVVEETAVFQTAPLPIFGNALQGQCSLTMVGSLIVDSFDSSNGPYGGSNLFTGPDAGASVASNSFTGSSGSSGVINGDVYYGATPDAAAGCTSSGESVTDSIVQGDVEEYPPMPFPPIVPTFTTATMTKDCAMSSSFEVSSNLFRYTPNTTTSNNMGSCGLTGTQVLELSVPVVDESGGPVAPNTFFVEGIGVGSTNNSVRVTKGTTGALCSSADLNTARCARTSLYVSTLLNLGGGGLLAAAGGNCDPTRFSIYYTGTANATLGGTSGFCGTIYAPNATVTIQGNTVLHGAISAKEVVTGGGVEIHYDLALARLKVMIAPFRTINQSRDVF